MGSFVRIEGLDLGIGKLISLDRTSAEVSYFSSPAQGEAHRERVRPSRIKRTILLAQTRVYWFNPDSLTWFVGRIAEDGWIDGRDLGMDEDHYMVLLPNKQSVRVPVSAMQVRWERPVDDPVAYLAARTTETPFWHIGRRTFLRQLVDQRAVCGSLTGLWSAAVELELHQFRTVRTVLTDPIQRYLLADEVGLGKTIEAGAILRQYVLDEPELHRAMVIVPKHLVAQWTDELVNRFYLSPYLDSTVSIVSEDDISKLKNSPPDLGMLIVDEAHHPAAMAFSSDPERRGFYNELAQLARRSPKLLLLSATPVLRNEDGFLAMLHLLDPEAYPLENREGFRLRVQNRQEIAESLSDLQIDSPAMFIEDALDTLQDLTKGDSRAADLITTVRNQLELDEDDPGRRKAIYDLREHISEVYRLHRRLVRHRRENLKDILRGRAGATVLSVSDPIRLRLGQLLERWREYANFHARSMPDARAQHDSPLYWLLLQGAASHPMVLHDLVAARRFGRKPSFDFGLCSPEDLKVLHMKEVFPEECEILDSLLAVDGTDAFLRLEEVVKVVIDGKIRRLKTIVFVDAPGVADRFSQALGSRLPGAVLRHAPGVTLASFLEQEGPHSVLVCDRIAEEGINLQSVRAQIIHLDLPFNPARLEQRLGRIDRFGARVQAASFIFKEEDPVFDAWQRCLHDVIQVFNRSVASLQYTLEEHLGVLRRTVFEEGVEAIEDLVIRLEDRDTGLEAELKRIKTQEQLDAMAEASEAELERFQALDEFDLDEDFFQTGLDSWSVERLQFNRKAEDSDHYIVRYYYELGRGRQTLLPPDQFVRWFNFCIDKGADNRVRATHKLGFSRSRCLRKGAQLARIGHPFIDALAELARCDDRGVAHAMWRLRPSLELPSDPWVVFGFDYLVEADPEVARLPETVTKFASNASIRRFLDEMLPPRYTTVWVDQDLEPVEDPSLLAALDKAYNNKWVDDQRDWNLSPTRWETVRPFLSLFSWEELCSNAADRAFTVMKQHLDLDEELSCATRRIDGRLSKVQAQLRARISRLPETAGVAESHVLQMEEALAEGARYAVRSPRVTPDSAFAVFLSTFNPFSEHSQ